VITDGDQYEEHFVVDDYLPSTPDALLVALPAMGVVQRRVRRA
jgi:hypothetical protein